MLPRAISQAEVLQQHVEAVASRTAEMVLERLGLAASTPITVQPHSTLCFAYVSTHRAHTVYPGSRPNPNHGPNCNPTTPAQVDAKHAIDPRALASHLGGLPLRKATSDMEVAYLPYLHLHPLDPNLVSLLMHPQCLCTPAPLLPCAPVTLFTSSSAPLCRASSPRRNALWPPSSDRPTVPRCCRSCAARRRSSLRTATLRVVSLPRCHRRARPRWVRVAPAR